MSQMSRFAERWRRMPMAVTAGLVLLLLAAGVGVILQMETAFRQQKLQENRVQAEILAASVVAPLDFGDRAAAQEAVDATRANRQVRGVGVYDRTERLVAGYRRDGLSMAPTLAESRERGRQSAGSGSVVVEVPVMNAGQQIGAVRFGTDPQPFAARVGRYLMIGLLAIMAALVVTVLGVAQGALRRVNKELEERARALADANAELTHQIAERTKAEEQLRQAQKMQALGQLTGGIAHDFNNLLTVIQGSADMLTRPDLPEQRRARFAEAIVQASSRAAALTSQLLAFARRQPLRPEVIDVNAMVAGMTELLDRTLGERITVHTRLESRNCTVEADRAQLESAVLNIAVNARDAMPDGGTLTITTAEAVDDAGNRMIGLSVADTGAGMDEATLARAMEPFFTTKGMGKGTGLGLSQVYGFATQSGGNLYIESSEGQGTTVTLLLPCSNASAVEDEETNARVARKRRSGSVLLVEDNPEVGEFGEALLDELGYRVIRVHSAPEAIEAAGKDKFDVVLTDVVMPGMSGLELAKELGERHPRLPVVLTTGYSDEIATSGAGGRPVVLKPYRLDTLAEALAEATGAKG